MAKEFTALGPGRPEEGFLPTGTVTFLFTDIAGSTRLVRADREAYAAALEDHRRLLRAAFAAHGGREVDTQGDSFFVAFPTAAQAVAAAAEAQRSLPATMPVRMGLHTGEATLAGNSYVGLAVHRAARIAAAAAGGQTLLSGTTAALVDEQLPAGTARRSLGAHRLKDFPQPAALYQLDVDGLPTDFPPPHTMAGEHRLPVSPGELLGRDDDLAVLTSLLRGPRTRLVTVTGTGGVGKTRLALEAAHAVAAHFPGGAVFVPLSAVADPALLLPTIADAVGARRERGVEPVDAVRTALGDDRTLLILDNLEQVAEAARELAALLDAVPAAVALVTSRQILRLRAEQQYPVSPLAEAAAVELFAERAAAVRPGFAIDTANEAAVSEICRRLDGLPLAIELAAARIRLMPPTALLTRLAQRLDVLGGGPVDLPERQRTLRATMDWSFGLLDPHEQALFARLAVFSGGWTLDAAETVCGRPGEPDVLHTLSALLDASLLVESGDSRLDMLETVRAYATEKLVSSADRSEPGRRHIEWVLAMIDPATHSGIREFRDGMAFFDRERANVRAAVQRAIDAADVETAALLIRNTFGYVTRRDAERETSGWLDQTLPLAAGAPPAVRGRLLIMRALVTAVSGDPAVRHLLEEGRRLVPDDAEHVYDHALAAYTGTHVAMADGSVEEASRCIDESAARMVAMGREVGVVFTTMFQANLALLRGDLDDAESQYRAVLELAGRLAEEAVVGQALSLLGLVLLARGDVPGARRAVLDGASANRRAGQPTSIAYSLEGLAAVALADGDPALAARALAAAAAIRTSTGRTLNPALTPLVDDLVARSREQLDDDAYAAACAEGRQWPLREALDRILDGLAVQ